MIRTELREFCSLHPSLRSGVSVRSDSLEFSLLFFKYEKRNNCSIFLEYFCIWLLRTCHLGPLENDWIQMANEKRQAQTGPEDQRVTATHPFLSPLYLVKNHARRPRILQPSASVSFGNRKKSIDINST